MNYPLGLVPTLLIAEGVICALLALAVVRSTARRRNTVPAPYSTDPALLAGAADTSPEATPQTLDYARSLTRSRHWWKRLRGTRWLGLLDAGQADLSPMLADPSPEVRTEAAAWVGKEPSEQTVRMLLEMVDDDDARCRRAGVEAVERLGRGAGAADAVLAHLDSEPPSPTGSLQLASRLAAPQLLPAALRSCSDEDAAVRSAAAEVAISIGGPEAFAALGTLLRDQSAQVRAVAARGIGRLEGRGLAGPLAELLHDPVWEVRHAAATALRALGTAGRVHLRRALTDPDPRASEIARHVVDLPQAALGVNP